MQFKSELVNPLTVGIRGAERDHRIQKQGGGRVFHDRTRCENGLLSDRPRVYT